MPHIIANNRTASLAAALAFLLAPLALGACGSSSSPSASADTSTTSSGAGSSQAPGGGFPSHRFTAMRECLSKSGIKLPERRPGAAPPAGGPRFGLPSGVTREQLRAALEKCGLHGGSFRPGASLHSSAFQARLTKFATCMRQNGVNLPAPNTSGRGPLFDTKGIDTTSATFKAAEAKCRSDLRFASPGAGAGRGFGPNGAPPSGEAPAEGG